MRAGVTIEASHSSIAAELRGGLAGFDPYCRVWALLCAINPGDHFMNRNPTALRIARMERECDVSCVPAVLLMVCCANLVLALVFGDLQPEMVAVRGGEQAGQATATAR
jgi:hypothetical protein